MPASRRVRTSRPNPCFKTIVAAGTCSSENALLPLGLERFGARAHDGIGRHQKRDFLERHEPERSPRNVNALPEAHGRDEHRVSGVAKRGEQTRLRRVALDEDAGVGQSSAELFVKEPHRAQRGREHEATAARQANELDDAFGCVIDETGSRRRRQIARRVEQRLAREIEGRADEELLDAHRVGVEPETRADVSERTAAVGFRAVGRERRAREDDGRHALEDALAQKSRHVDGSRAQRPPARAALEPRDPAGPAVHDRRELDAQLGHAPFGRFESVLGRDHAAPFERSQPPARSRGERLDAFERRVELEPALGDMAGKSSRASARRESSPAVTRASSSNSARAVARACSRMGLVPGENSGSPRSGEA